MLSSTVYLDGLNQLLLIITYRRHDWWHPPTFIHIVHKAHQSDPTDEQPDDDLLSAFEVLALKIGLKRT